VDKREYRAAVRQGQNGNPDRLLVQFWGRLRPSNPKVVEAMAMPKDERETRACFERLFPEVTKRGITDRSVSTTTVITPCVDWRY
jgi:hypothetical protein